MKGKLAALVATGFACLIAALPAQAATDVVAGLTATVDFYYPNISTLYCSSGTAVIGDGVEYPAGCSGFSAVSIDISNGGLTVGHSSLGFDATAFNGFVLHIEGFDFTVVSWAGGQPLDVTSVAITDGDLWLNYSGQGTGSMNFSFVGELTSVPEPATLALLGLGLTGLAALRRRRVQ